MNFWEQKACTCCLIDLQWVSKLLRLTFSISWIKKIRNQSVSNPTKSTFSKYIEVPEHDQVTLMGFLNHVIPPPATTHKRNHKSNQAVLKNSSLIYFLDMTHHFYRHYLTPLLVHIVTLYWYCRDKTSWKNSMKYYYG